MDAQIYNQAFNTEDKLINMIITKLDHIIDCLSQLKLL